MLFLETWLSLPWLDDSDVSVKQVEIEEGPGTLAPYAMTMTKLDMTRDRCYELVNLYY